MECGEEKEKKRKVEICSVRKDVGGGSLLVV